MPLGLRTTAGLGPVELQTQPVRDELGHGVAGDGLLGQYFVAVQPSTIPFAQR